jgi:hypothetical protein
MAAPDQGEHTSAIRVGQRGLADLCVPADED